MFTLLQHPALVHAPIGIALILPLLVLLLLWKYRQAWSLLLPVALAFLLSAMIALRSGEEVEDQAEERGVSHQQIHQHEELAEAVPFLGGALVLLVAAGIWAPVRFRQPLRILALLASLVVLGQLLRVGQTGGEITHGSGKNLPPGSVYDED